MLKIKNNNVLMPITVWNDLKMDLYFSELNEAFETSAPSNMVMG